MASSVASGSSIAMGANRCEAVFSDVASEAASRAAKNLSAREALRFPQESIFDFATRSRIERILAETSRPGKDRWGDIVDIYLGTRLQVLPRGLAKSLALKLTRFKIQFQRSSNRIDATTNGIEFPVEFENTPLPYVILVHELEHLIGTSMITKSDNPSSGTLTYLFNPVEMYREETRAMSAEWELAQFISASEASEMAALSQSILQTQKDRTFVEAIANFRDLDRTQYLKATRATGRYSALNVVQKTSRHTAIASATAGYLTGMAWGACALIHWIAN